MSEKISGRLVTKDNIEIAYDHYKRGHSKAVIVAPGFCNSKKALLMTSLVSALVDTYDVIVFDFRGHGESEGVFTWTSNEYLDLLAVCGYVGKNYSQIGCIGFSLGAATSIIAASQTNLIDSLVSICSPSEFWKIEYHFWQLDFETDIIYNLFKEGKIGKGVRMGPFWLKKKNPINCIEKIEAPILFVHGTRDWIIKQWHSKALYDKTKFLKELTVIQGGLHAEYLIRKQKEEFISIMKNWFQKTLN